MEFPHVFFQVKVPTKPLSAEMASKRFLVIVRVHMKRQIVDLVESLVADCTFILLLAGVGEFMVLVVAFLVEPLPAEFADVGFVAQVDSHVCVERTAAVKRFAAGLAFVRFFRCVDDFVPA
jgi:hypothetical protein